MTAQSCDDSQRAELSMDTVKKWKFTPNQLDLFHRQMTFIGLAQTIFPVYVPIECQTCRFWVIMAHAGRDYIRSKAMGLGSFCHQQEVTLSFPLHIFSSVNSQQIIKNLLHSHIVYL